MLTIGKSRRRGWTVVTVSKASIDCLPSTVVIVLWQYIQISTRPPNFPLFLPLFRGFYVERILLSIKSLFLCKRSMGGERLPEKLSNKSKSIFAIVTKTTSTTVKWNINFSQTFFHCCCFYFPPPLFGKQKQNWQQFPKRHFETLFS